MSYPIGLKIQLINFRQISIFFGIIKSISDKKPFFYRMAHIINGDVSFTAFIFVDQHTDFKGFRFKRFQVIQDEAHAQTGINNVFDRAYAYHVNRANVDPFNPDAVQVNEPGREFWLRLSANF